MIAVGASICQLRQGGIFRKIEIARLHGAVVLTYLTNLSWAFLSW